MKNAYYIMLLLLGSVFSGCSDFLDPEADNTMNEDEVFATAAYFCGPLNDVYSDLPKRFNAEMDVMTDNAVRNDFTGNYYRCGNGALSPNLNPMDMWEQGYRNIRKLNIFISKMVLDYSKPFPTPVRFFALTNQAAKNDNLGTFYRLLGEAYVLRAFWQMELLKNFGGEAADGQILGVPLVGNRILDVEQNIDIPRSTYQQCVDAIVADCDRALENIPVGGDATVPDLYRGTGNVTGKTMIGRASRAAAKAIKARALLFIASPAYNKPYDASKWETAAMAAAEAIKALGNPALFTTRNNYYFDMLTNTDTPVVDVVLRGGTLTGNAVLENENFPRGMYGSAQVNVSQNLVDAFPDANGYPIAESGSYIAQAPYANRDPRLGLFVACNNTTLGAGNYYTLQSWVGGQDGYQPQDGTSRSGYYLKKGLKSTLSLRPGASTSTVRANVLIGMPEVFLTFAEAANEAWGVTGNPKGYDFTAKDILTRIVTRNNTTTDATQMSVAYTAGATYLNTEVGTDPAKFRTLVRNERRLELCFEGHYYYDLRRWISDNSTSTINVPVRGMKITKTGSLFTYDPTQLLETRTFRSPAQPLPYKELFCSPSLVQNYGW